MYHRFNIKKFYVLPTQYIYVLCVDLRTNSDYFPTQIQHVYCWHIMFTARYETKCPIHPSKTRQLYYGFHGFSCSSAPSQIFLTVAEPIFRLSVSRGGADKFLAWRNSQCRRTESIVSLERGIRSCDELQVFSCYRGWKEECQATRAISTTSRRELSLSQFFPARQGAEGNSHHSDRKIRGTCSNVCHRQKLGGPL